MINVCRRYIETGRAIAGEKASSSLLETFRLLLHRVVTGYGPDHYVTYSLFNTPISISRWREYVDKRDFCRILHHYNKKSHFKVLEDKVQFASRCRDFGLPHPTIRFTINYTGEETGFPNVQGETVASTFDALEDGDYIVKTCAGSYGINLWSITKSDRGILVHNDAVLLPAERFAERLSATGESYLVQDKVEVTRKLRSVMPGLACGSMRVNSFVRPDGSVVIPYVWVKLTVDGPVCDNFSGGATGNLLAVVDIERLCITRVVKKSARGLLTDITHHPDTGVDLRDYSLPELVPAMALTRRCALAFSDIPAVGWDIVVTDKGAMVFEGNPMFDPIGPQFCAGQGIRTAVPRLLQG